MTRMSGIHGFENVTCPVATTQVIQGRLDQAIWHLTPVINSRQADAVCGHSWSVLADVLIPHLGIPADELSQHPGTLRRLHVDDLDTTFPQPFDATRKV